MKHETHAGRRLRAPALLVLTCLLIAAAGCKKDEADDGGSDDDDMTADTPRDGGDNGSEVEDPRIGPDGAVQVREQPEDDCATVNGNGSSYFFCPAPLPYTMAVGSCWAAGSTLVTVNDAAENQFLVDEMSEDEYWIGYTDANEEDTWDWAEGSEGSSYENWDEGQPGIDDFAYIKRETGAWSTSTDVPRPYICEVWH